VFLNTDIKEKMMKKLVMFIAAMTMFSVITTGYAQVRAGSVTVSPTIGGYMFEGNEDMDNSLSLGLRAGYNFTKYIGIEGFVHYAPTEIRQTGTKEKMNFLGYGIEGIFHILPNGPLVPFVAAGVGGVHYSASYDYTTEDKNNKLAVDYGAGLKYFLTENFALRADVRHVIPFDGMHNNLLYTVGFSFAFGGAKKATVTEGRAAPEAAAPVAVIIDSDGDGVPDNLDRCPGTPAGVSVDMDGCPVDSDQDGVPDYLDDCPKTPAGVTVDKNGCPPPEPVVQEVKPQAEAAPEKVEKGRITLNVLFDTNKDTIKKNSLKDVDDLVAVMKKYPDLNVTIEGHTDNVGKAAYNKKLSQRRAEAVKKYMVEKAGINANRLTAKGFGPDQPVASNATKEGRQKNRRVEAELDYIIKK
jgi:OmpA-OmpF porin, OOP family